MVQIDFTSLKEQLSPSDICQILGNYGVAPRKDTINYIIFPTCCHNLVGGSSKLYYYKDSHSFHCYTECNDNFDIFTLIQKMEALRGNEISLAEAIRKCGFNSDEYIVNASESLNEIQDYVNFIYKVKNRILPQTTLKPLDDAILNRFVFDENVLNIWVKEGISLNVMRKYGISYDPIDNCIIIPTYDDKSNLIGIRGRYLNEEAYAKYKPNEYGGKTLKYPSSALLYGLNFTKERIRATGRAILFEAEKSVLMSETLYGDKNIAVGVFGQNISIEQMLLLIKYGAEEIVLAFDADYQSWREMDNVRAKYLEIAQRLKPYFTVSIIIDQDRKWVKYKDSPIDCGKKSFEELINQRIIC